MNEEDTVPVHLEMQRLGDKYCPSKLARAATHALKHILTLGDDAVFEALVSAAYDEEGGIVVPSPFMALRANIGEISCQTSRRRASHTE